MKIELLKKRKLEIGLSLFIGMSVFWGCNNDLIIFLPQLKNQNPRQ